MARRKRRIRRKFTIGMKRTLAAIMLVIAVSFIALIVRIFYIVDNDQERYKKRVLAQQSYISNELKYRRGDIVDRNGTALAISVKVYDVALSPKDLLDEENAKNGEYTIEQTAKFFGLDEKELREAIDKRKNSKYLLLEGAKGISEEKKLEFDQLVEESEKTSKEYKVKDEADMVNVPPVINNVWFEERYERKYPLSTVGCQIIGFTDGDNGSIGIEEHYNDALSGSNGREYGYYDSELNLQRTVKPAINGDTVVSSIDANVQGILEKRIKAYKKDPGAKNIAIMIMDPNNGEIIGMASDKQFDLNEPRNLSEYFTQAEIDAMDDSEKTKNYNAMWRNFCINETYEPGSTFKTFTVAAALDEGTVNPNWTVNCAGETTVGEYQIGCANRVSHGVVTPKIALMQSCNVALLNMAIAMGGEQFRRYMDLYGFGRKTGIDIIGEEMGLLHDVSNLHAVQLATSSFGQTQNVTMVQMLSAFCSVINGGKYYQPHVVKEIVNEQGGVVEKMDGRVLRQTITSQTSEFIKDALLATVKEGTAKPAAVPGYEISGKTGTAEKHGKESDGKYIVSFIGFVPYDKPQIAIYVLIDEPNVEDQAHSTYATEFASKIMKEILPFLGLYADTGETDAGTTDAGTPDAGTTDAGTPDAGTTDAGTPDAGTPDAGTTDAGTPDAGTPDAGTPDAGTTDAGTPDAGTTDAGTTDAGTPEAGTPDAGTIDSIIIGADTQ